MTSPRRISVVVVDDQPLARVRVRDLLAEIPWAECVGEAADGPAALSLIAEAGPDVALLDIQMPGMSGLEVLRRAQPRPYAVFTTAHDHHAVVAFELQALDYLLKPFGPERLVEALERAKERLDSEDRLAQLERARIVSAPNAHPDRVFVRERGRIVPVLLSQVEHVEAERDYVSLWVGPRSHLLRVTMSQLERTLDPGTFLRVHRSHLINIDHVADFRAFDGARLQVTLRSGKAIVASRTRTRELKARLVL